MKNLSLIVFIIFCHSLQSISQGYTPMVVDNARWVYQGYGALAEERFGFEILGDTIINNTSYKKAYHLQITNGPSNSPIIIEDKSLIAVLREDVNTKKVYCLALNIIFQISEEFTCVDEMASGEYLLYDFDVTVGDTLSTCLSQTNEPGFETIIVESISPEVYDGYTLNTFSCSFNFHLIEGIGFDNGLFQKLTPEMVPAGNGYRLSTYCREVNVNDCKESSNKNIQWNELSFHPNPMNDFISINAELPFTNIELYDYNGKLHLTTLIESNTSYEMDVSNLRSGMYILKIANDQNEYAFHKMIKQ